MWGKKKMAKKTRNHDEINTEYNQHAPLAAHKSVTIRLMEAEISRLEAEVEGHFKAMFKLRQEASALPPPSPETKAPPEAATA